ncbi:hypothetical protein QUA08_31000, partial [Microcoleus sp. T3B2]
EAKCRFSPKAAHLIILLYICKIGMLPWASVPLVGYNFFQKINNLVDTTLVTHIRNKPALEKHPEYEKIFYLEEGNLTKQYYKILA